MAVGEDIYRGGGQAPGAAPLPEASADVFGAGIGRALEGAGNTLEGSSRRAMQAEKQRKYQVDASVAGVEAAQAGLDVDQEVAGIREHAGPGAAGHVEAVTAAVDKRFNDALGKIGDQHLREQYRVVYARDRARIIANEDGWARGVRVEYQGANVRKTTDLLGNRVFGNPDDGTFNDALTTLGTTIGAQGLSADLTEKLYREGAQTLAISKGRGMIEVDPAAALVAISHGTLDEWITPEQKAALVDKAQVGVNAAQVAADKQLRAQQAEARGYLEVLGKRFADNDPSITDDELSRAQQLATVLKEEGKAYDVAKWRVWHQVDTTYRDASALQVSNQIHALDATIRKAGDKASADDVVARDRLQGLLERKQRLEGSDPLTSSGVAIAPLNPGDLNSLRSRATAATAAQQQTGHYAFLTPQEVSQFKEEIASGPNGKLATINFLGNVAQVDGQAALRAAAQIDPNDRTLRHALRVAPAVREMIVRGAAAKASLPSRVIGPDGDTASVDSLTETWFADNVSPALVRSQPEFANDVLDSARAIYADWRRRSGSAGQDEEFNAGQFGQAVNLALGSVGGGRGGVGSWRDGPRRANGQAYPFVLPSRFNQAEFERRLANPIVVAGIHKAPYGSVNGTPAWANGKPVSLADLKAKFVPVAIKDGIYQFHSGGRVAMTAPEPGRPSRPFQVDVRRIPPAAPAAHRPAPRDHLGSGASMQPAIPAARDTGVRGPVWIGAPGGED